MAFTVLKKDSRSTFSYKYFTKASIRFYIWVRLGFQTNLKPDSVRQVQKKSLFATCFNIFGSDILAFRHF